MRNAGGDNMLPKLYEICTPREDVLKGAVRETEFAADLAQVIRGDAPDDYKLPERFFANTHPTGVCANCCVACWHGSLAPTLALAQCSGCTPTLVEVRPTA